MNHYIGIDVAKATLQIFIPKTKCDFEIDNSTTGLRLLIKKLKEIYGKSWVNSIFIYESTGSYSTNLELFCEQEKIHCFKVGAYQSASFAKTIKNRNKTDKVDARMLSQMHILVKKGDVNIPTRDQEAHQIRSFIKYYQSLNKEKTRLKNYLEAAEYNHEDEYILAEVKERIKKLSASKEKVMKKILAIIDRTPSYLKAYKHILSIKGVGEKSGAVLLYLFLRYPNASRQQITALSGLDPISRESGTSLMKKTRISKQGLSLVRGILYMPMLSIVRFNPEMKYYYERLLKKGKPKMSAQIAIMRKVILLAHSLYKNEQDYDPERYQVFLNAEKKVA